MDRTRITTGPERVGLSWQRTALAFTVTSATLLRWLPAVGPIVLVPLAILFLLVAGISLTQHRRYRSEVLGTILGWVPPATRSVLALTAGMLIFGSSELALLLL